FDRLGQQEGDRLPVVVNPRRVEARQGEGEALQRGGFHFDVLRVHDDLRRRSQDLDANRLRRVVCAAGDVWDDVQDVLDGHYGRERLAGYRVDLEGRLCACGVRNHAERQRHETAA